MKRYRMFLSCLVAVSLVLSCTFNSMAVGLTPIIEVEDQLTEEERAFVEAKMVSYEVAGNDIVMEVLYDKNGDAAYILGSSENGYIIVGQDDYFCYEAGEMNPYTGYEGVKKYFGGILHYYVGVSDGENISW